MSKGTEQDLRIGPSDLSSKEIVALQYHQCLNMGYTGIHWNYGIFDMNMTMLTNGGASF